MNARQRKKWHKKFMDWVFYPPRVEGNNIIYRVKEKHIKKEPFDENQYNEMMDYIHCSLNNNHI